MSAREAKQLKPSVAHIMKIRTVRLYSMQILISNQCSFGRFSHFDTMQTDRIGRHHQPPSGGCELKRLTFLKSVLVLPPAAFGRL